MDKKTTIVSDTMKSLARDLYELASSYSRAADKYYNDSGSYENSRHELEDTASMLNELSDDVLAVAELFSDDCDTELRQIVAKAVNRLRKGLANGDTSGKKTKSAGKSPKIVKEDRTQDPAGRSC